MRNQISQVSNYGVENLNSVQSLQKDSYIGKYTVLSCSDSNFNTPFMQKYEQIEQIGEGTYGVVIKCRNKQTNELVAIKRFKEPEDLNDPSYLKITQREVQMLCASKHPFVVKLIEAFKRKTRMYFIFEYCQTTVLDLIEQLTERDVKLIVLQLLHAVQFLHSRKIVHRDIKPENLLITYHNQQPVLKLCDFGFARPQNVQMTDYVATRWYRSPELLLNSKHYNYSVDTWAIGCLIYEMLTTQPLFPGDSDIQTLQMIVQLCGSMTNDLQQLLQRNPKYFGIKINTSKQYNLQDYLSHKLRRHNRSQDSIDLIKKILVIDETQRISISELIQDKYFDEVRDQVAQYEKYWYEKEKIQQPRFDSATTIKSNTSQRNRDTLSDLTEQAMRIKAQSRQASPTLDVSNLILKQAKPKSTSPLLNLTNIDAIQKQQNSGRYPPLPSNKSISLNMNIISQPSNNSSTTKINYQTFTLPEQPGQLTSNASFGSRKPQPNKLYTGMNHIPKFQQQQNQFNSQQAQNQNGLLQLLTSTSVKTKPVRRSDSRNASRFMGISK